MNITKTLYVKDRNKWRQWLARNYNREKEIWLLIPKKNSGKIGVSYNDAVEEALCFGWIDSMEKGYDEKTSAQRFTPRNPKTPYSRTNIERLKRLIKERKVLKSVLDNIPQNLKNPDVVNL